MVFCAPGCHVRSAPPSSTFHIRCSAFAIVHIQRACPSGDLRLHQLPHSLRPVYSNLYCLSMPTFPHNMSRCFYHPAARTIRCLNHTKPFTQQLITTKRRSEEEWARGEFVHHYITSNSTLSTTINITPKPPPMAAKFPPLGSTSLSYQRHGGKCVPSPRTAKRTSIDSPRGAA
jgi:hypothetical protein